MTYEEAESAYEAAKADHARAKNKILIAKMELRDAERVAEAYRIECGIALDRLLTLERES